MIGCIWAPEADPKSLREAVIGLSPQIEQVAPNCLLFRCDENASLPKLDVAARMGIAANRFVAACSIRCAQEGECLVVPVGEEATFLAPLPISWLPADGETLRRLQLLGLEQMGQLAALPKEQLYLPLGDEGIVLWELASGIDERPLVPTPQEEVLAITTDFDAPCFGGEWFVHSLMQSLQQLFAQLQSRGLHALELHLLLSLEEGELPVTVHFVAGTRLVDQALGALQRELKQTPLSAPIEQMTLFVTRAVRLAPTQMSLFDPKRHHHLPQAISRLKAKGNPRALMHVAWDDPKHRLPERRAHLQSLLHEQIQSPLLTPCPVSSALFATSSILDHWEVEEEWWTDQPIHRSYFRVATPSGGYLRLFCDQQSQSWFRQ